MESPFFHHQQVRDLAWALFSPSLLLNLPTWVKNWQPQLNTTELAWLQELDKNPYPLLDHLNTTNTGILGMYFEALWGFYLKTQCKRQLITQNLQIQGEKQTLGEFDALLRDDNNQIFHLEMACKFYLKAPQLVNHHPMSHWLGPQCRDRLDLKLGKTLNQQLLLGQLPEAQQQLASMNIETLLPEAVFKGWLFNALSDEAFDSNPMINKQSNKGLWLKTSDLHVLSSGHYQILPKSRWLSLAWQEDKPDNLSTLLQLCSKHFEHKNFALMAAKMEPSHNGWHETQRLMIVPEPWPY